MTPDLFRPSSSSCSGRPVVGLTMLLEGSRAGEAQWREHRFHRQTILAPSSRPARTSTMQNLQEPIAPAAAAKEELPWPVSVVYHRSQHLTKTMQRMAGRLVSSL